MTGSLLVEHLSVSYANVPAVQGVSLKMRPGSITSIVGANGAGKSSLLNGIMGLVPAKGRVVLGGARVDALTTEARARAGMCLVPETRDLFGTMSVHDNLRLGAYARPISSKQIEQEIAAICTRFPRLGERLSQAAETLSGGERQMLALGRALLGQPEVLLLDEPSLGLAPMVVRDILHTLKELSATGLSILLVEQNARAALAISEYAYVMELGAIVLEGPADDLANDRRLEQKYLGTGGH